MGFVVCFLSGCRRDEKAVGAESVDAARQNAVLLEKLESIREDRNDLAKSRNIVVKKMTAMIEAKLKARGIEKPTESDLAAIKAELEKEPEWQSLYRRCVDVNTAINENLRKSQGTVRQSVRTAKAGQPATISK